VLDLDEKVCRILQSPVRDRVEIAHRLEHHDAEPRPDEGIGIGRSRASCEVSR